MAFVYQSLQHFALGAEPVAVVYQFGVLRHDLVLEMGRAPVKRDLLNASVSLQQNCSARSLVNAARLHSDIAVLDEIESADAVAPSQIVQFSQQLGGRHSLSVDGDRIAGFEFQFDEFRLVRRVLGMGRPLVDVVRRFGGRIFQNFAFGRCVEQIRVYGERRFAKLVLGQRDLMLLGEFHELGAAGQLPLPPWRDHLDGRVQRVCRKFKANLVVAFAGRSVRHRVRACFARDFHEPLRDQRPGD